MFSFGEGRVVVEMNDIGRTLLRIVTRSSVLALSFP